MQDNFSYTRPTTPPLRIRSAPPLTQGRQALRGTKDGGLPLRFPVSRPKRRGFTGGTWFLSPAQTAPGAHLIKPPQSPEKPAPCGIAPLSRRGADRARSPPANAGVRFPAIHLPEIYGILGVPAKAALLWGAVPQWRFRRNARDQEGRQDGGTKREDWPRLGMPYGGRPF